MDDAENNKGTDLEGLPFLTLEQVAQLLQVSRFFVRDLMDAGRLPYATLSLKGAKKKPVYRFLRSDVDEFMRNSVTRKED